jgi:hypothetical protein
MNLGLRIEITVSSLSKVKLQRILKDEATASKISKNTFVFFLISAK